MKINDLTNSFYKHPVLGRIIPLDVCLFPPYAYADNDVLRLTFIAVKTEGKGVFPLLSFTVGFPDEELLQFKVLKKTIQRERIILKTTSQSEVDLVEKLFANLLLNPGKTTANEYNEALLGALPESLTKIITSQEECYE